ncbi:hypothetical protein ES705_47232 [subsurface metagenome]
MIMPSLYFPISLAWEGLEIPKPTQIGFSVNLRILVKDNLIVRGNFSLTPVTPVKET